MQENKPVVAILMGSNSDWDVMKNAAEMLKSFDVPFEAKVVSAHRMPDEMFEYAETARDRGIRVIIAGAGGAAHRLRCSRPEPLPEGPGFSVFHRSDA